VEGFVPTYQYACTACGHQLEAVQSFADDPLTECPACEGRLRKLYSAVGIVFKGSGFYRTDSRNGGKTGGSSKPTESKSETKTETKSETKTETKSSDSSSSSSSTSSKSTAPAA
jgi:putative FmdB family regulatory protein